MAKKNPTLKHRLASGEVATRTTAHAYTHVLVATRNQARALNNLAAREAAIPKLVAKFRRDLEKSHTCYAAMLATPMGERAVNWNGYAVTINEFHHNAARAGLCDYGTIDEQVAAYQAEQEKNIRDVRAVLESTPPTPKVISWHSSAALAMKAGNVSHLDNYDCVVEEINNGERA